MFVFLVGLKFWLPSNGVDFVSFDLEQIRDGFFISCVPCLDLCLRSIYEFYHVNIYDLV